MFYDILSDLKSHRIKEHHKSHKALVDLDAVVNEERAAASAAAAKEGVNRSAAHFKSLPLHNDWSSSIACHSHSFARLDFSPTFPILLPNASSLFWGLCFGQKRGPSETRAWL